MKKKSLLWLWIGLGIIAFLAVAGVGAYYFMEGGKLPAVVNNGASMKAVIVDSSGNVLSDVGGQSGTSQSVISQSGQTGFNIIDNVNTFLAIQTKLDNSAGDSEVIISGVTGTNPCSAGNLNSNCPSITNIFGATGTHKGAIDSKWSALAPIDLPKGSQSAMVQSDPMSIAPVELGLVDFRLDVAGNYLDSNGNPQPLTGKYGSITLKINSQTCTDGTNADTTLGDSDINTYCSTVNKGKYCRVDAYGTPQLTDRASLCGCPTDQYAQGEVCKATACTAGTCIAGTVNFCVDGSSIETRCQQCGVANCPLDVNSQTATGCNPATSGVVSQCTYPTVQGSGFSVFLSSPTFSAIDLCGDGVKNGAEQCDGSDFGGASCTSQGFNGGTLTCSGSCTYVTSACQSAYVKFRTLYSSISGSANADEIAFNNACNGAVLTKAGEYSAGGSYSATGDCANAMGNAPYSATLQFYITNGVTSVVRASITGTQNPSLWLDTNGVYHVCADRAGGGYAQIAFKTINPASTISNSASSVDTSKETNC